jgi:thiol-disulfide isomerase/thioredoxin
MIIIEINTFQKYIDFIRDNNNIILNVSATWCKPCMNMKNEIEIYMKNLNSQIFVFGKINFDIINDDDDFNQCLTIKKIPYFCIIKNKNIENEIISSNINEITNFIDNNIDNIDNFELNNDF